MADDPKYENLVSQRKRAQQRYDACRSDIDSLRLKLDRLYPVKRVLAGEKSDFKTIKKDTKKYIEDDYEWLGSAYTEFLSKGEELNDECENFYKEQLDRVLDELNNEITRLENEISNKFGLLGRLGSEINSLANKIENFFN